MFRGSDFFLKEARVTKGTLQGRHIIRPAFLRGSLLRKVTWKAGSLQEGRPERRLQQYARRVTVRAWNPLGEFSFPSDILICTLSKNANKLDGVHSGTKLSTFSGLLRGAKEKIQIWANHLEKASVPQLPCSFGKQFPGTTQL